MRSIVENPYRVLGLSCGASEREIAKRVTELNVFLDMGKTRSYPNDLSSIWPLERTKDSISAAASKLEVSDDRERHCSFWFWENTPIDTLAFDILRRGEPGQALTLWGKALALPNKHHSLSHARNVSLLHMGLMGKSDTFGLRHCTASLSNAAVYFSSPDADGLAPGGMVIKTPLKRRAQYFIEEFLAEISGHIDRSGGPTKRDLVTLLAAFPPETQTHATNKLLAESLQLVRSIGEQAASQRSRAPLEGCSIAKAVLRASRSPLDDLRNAVGRGDPRYTVPADNLANEALQCSIDHFNAATPAQVRPIIGDAVDIADSAELLASSEAIQVRARNTAIFYRERLAQITGTPAPPNVRELMNDVASRLEDLPDAGSLTPAQLEILPRLLGGFLDVVVPPLKIIASVLGPRNGEFLHLSSDAAEAVMDRLPVLLEKGGAASSIAPLIDRTGRMHLLPATRDQLDALKIVALRVRATRRKKPEVSNTTAHPSNVAVAKAKTFFRRLIPGLNVA